MSWFSWLQALVTFRKSGSSEFIVPELDAQGRIKISLLSESPVLVQSTAPSIIDGSTLWYNTNDNKLYYYNGVAWIVQISEDDHKNLRQLIHLADSGGPYEGFASGAYREILPTGNPFPTSIIWWESAAKLKKIVEKTISYAQGYAKPTPIVYKVYATDGSTVLSTVTDSISYSGPYETSRSRTIS